MHARWRWIGWMPVLAAALAAGRPAAAQQAGGGYAPAVLAAPADPRLWPAPARRVDARWTARPAGGDGSAPFLSRRGAVIGSAVGCAAGAASALISDDTPSAREAVANAAAWCFFYMIPGAILGAIWIDD